MKLLITAPAGEAQIIDPTQEEPVVLTGHELKIFNGIEDETVFSDYVDEDFPDCVTGGYMYFRYSPQEQKLMTVTEYETTRKLTPEEEQIVIEYTQGQWSDGIGEGFEQHDLGLFKGAETYLSPWFQGQKATVTYKD